MPHLIDIDTDRHPLSDDGAATEQPLGGVTVWLLVILAAGLVLRLWLLPYRWINPDEGAHLMDGQLILHGLVPFVDFQSRQPLYAYIQAALLGMFGGSYLMARLLPVAAITCTAFLVFVIGRRLFNPQVALLATAIYTFHPLIVIWSPVVKTEPTTALLSSLAVYFTVRFTQQDERLSFLALAGAGLALAFYVRQSSLAVALALVVFLLVTLRRRPLHLARAYASFAAGGLTIVVIVVALYSRDMTAAEMWRSQLNPLSLALGAVDKLATATAAGTAGGVGTPSQGGDALRLAAQSWSRTAHYVRETISVNAFLFVGLVISFGILAYLRVRKAPEFHRVARPLLLLSCWAITLMLAYAYWAVHRGYFTQYFNETVPPLAIVLAFVLWYLARVLAPAVNGRALILFSGAVLAGVFAAHRLHPALDLPNPLIVLGPALLLALVSLRRDRRRRWSAVLAVVVLAVVAGGAAGKFVPMHLATVLKLVLTAGAVVAIALFVRERGVERSAFGGLVVLAAAFLSAVAASGRVMGVAYECVWSPRTVAAVARYIRAHTAPGDQVMSGAVIWAVAAGRPPFMMISHPLAYDGGASPEDAARMRAYLHARPPQLIVLDGYTDRTYLSYLDTDGRFLAANYTLAGIFPGSRYPVKIYTMRESDISRR